MIYWVHLTGCPTCRQLVSSKQPGDPPEAADGTLLVENSDRESRVECPPRSHLVHQVSLQAELCLIQFPKDLADFLNMTSKVRQREKGFDLDSV